MAGFLHSLMKDRNLENNLEFLQQLALHNYNKNGEESKPFYSFVTSARVANELYQRVSGKRRIEDFKKQCVANIVDYIQKHPDASSSAIQKEVENQITIFALRVSTM